MRAGQAGLAMAMITMTLPTRGLVVGMNSREMSASKWDAGAFMYKP